MRRWLMVLMLATLSIGGMAEALSSDVGEEVKKTLGTISSVADALGGLEHVRIAQMLVFVASTPDFGGQSTVADAASELLVEVLGENGRHARTAIGVASLPRNSPVEIQLVCGPA